MNKLHFLTAGLPLASEGKGYNIGLNILKNMGLDGLEAEFVHGVKMTEPNQKFIKSFISENNIIVSFLLLVN